MAESLRVHARDLADYLNQTVLDHDEVTTADVLDALASLGITLVEDPVSDSTRTYHELLLESDEDREPDESPETFSAD